MHDAQQECAKRRKQCLKQMGKGAIAILPAAQEVTRNADCHYPFRQNSDFHYLTGFNEPDAVAVFIPHRKAGEYILFCHEKNPLKELWEGKRAGQAGAQKDFLADEAFPLSSLDAVMPILLQDCQRVYYPTQSDTFLKTSLFEWVKALTRKTRAGIQAPHTFINIDTLIHPLRVIKSAYEIQIMRKAAAISVEAHRQAMQKVKPGCYEYELEATLLHHFHQHNSRSPAYNSIVGSGPNACILHYTQNDRQIKSGDLVLIDAGCEYQGYASDITRTFPVNGEFTPAQKALYSLVLKTQLGIISLIKPGLPWNKLQEYAIKKLTEGLVSLGLLHGKVNTLIQEKKYLDFYMHNIGHFLGRDVHDVGAYKIGDDWRRLEPGMVLAIEPAVYVAPDNKKVDARWRGIGIRIEDDVLVTPRGHEVLTAALPKTVEDVCQLIAN